MTVGFYPYHGLTPASN